MIQILLFILCAPLIIGAFWLGFSLILSGFAVTFERVIVPIQKHFPQPFKKISKYDTFCIMFGIVVVASMLLAF